MANPIQGRRINGEIIEEKYITLFNRVPAKLSIFKESTTTSGIRNKVVPNLRGSDNVPIDYLFDVPAGLYLGNLKLLHPTLLYYPPNPWSPSRSGQWLECQTTFEGPLKSAGTILHTLFGLQIPAIEIACQLGQSNHWELSTCPNSMVFVGDIGNISKEMGALQLKSLGLSASAHLQTDSIPPFHRRYVWQTTFFGCAQLQLGSSAPPSPEFQYSLRDISGRYHISMAMCRGKVWQDAFKIKHFSLSSVEASSQFTADETDLDLGFRLSMVLSFTTLFFQGRCTKGFCEFQAKVGHLTWEHILLFHSEVFSVEIPVVLPGLQVEDLSLFVSSENDMFVFRGRVRIEEVVYEAAEIAINSSGMKVRANGNDIWV